MTSGNCIALSLLSVILQVIPAGAQAIPTPSSRVEEIQARRLARQSQLTPAEPDKVEQAFVTAQDVASRITASPSGLRLKFSSTAPGWGGFIPGSGFAVGGEYFRPDLSSGQVVFRTSAVGTTKSNYLFDTQVTFPQLMNARLMADLLGRYKAERSINYYGPGPRTRKGDRTNYSRETSEVGVGAAWRPVRHLIAGASAGALWFNVGPGIANGISSTEQIFDPAAAPGIEQQTDFVRTGLFAGFDSRLSEALSPRGTQIGVRFDDYHDLNDRGYSFGVLHAVAQHVITFFNEKRLIILRADSATSHMNRGDVVPFYLQQTLGGPDDLRGFRLFRFTDNNRLALNAEYRWEIAPPMDMALFADGGKVFHDAGQLNFSHIEGAAGIGFRIKTRSAVPLRVDFAFSREGVNLWFRFSDLF
jgi:hypothetical protein